jgi:c-di-GMP-related signal transduction protein
MRFAIERFGRSVTAAVLVSLFGLPSGLIAQSSQHLVSPSDLQKAAVDASQARQKNLDTLNNFLSSDKAKDALESANIDPQQVKKAVAGLNDEELAQLAKRAQKAQADFAAGNIDDRDLLIILVCVAVLILVIVAVR